MGGMGVCHPQIFVVHCPPPPLGFPQSLLYREKPFWNRLEGVVLWIGFRNSQSFRLNVTVTEFMILKHIDRLFVVMYLNPQSVVCTLYSIQLNDWLVSRHNQWMEMLL